MALSQNRTPETVAPDVAAFVSSLATAWRAGEVRPTHRREPKQDVGGAHVKTLCRGLAGLAWLEGRPELEAKERLKGLHASGYREVPGSHVRTLPRRVRCWR